MSNNNILRKTRREEREAKLKRRRTLRTVTWAAVIVVGIALVGGLVWFFSRSTTTVQAAGDVVPVSSRDHIPVGTDPGPYPSDPPAGGRHYPVTYDPGFYTPEAVQSLPKYYAGYLVHNEEHGYVIFWYNCQADPKINCTDLQNAIKQVINENNTFKVIGFPWPSMKTPLAITAWGRILRLDNVDLPTMRAFYRTYVNKGPEQTPD